MEIFKKIGKFLFLCFVVLFYQSIAMSWAEYENFNYFLVRVFITQGVFLLALTFWVVTAIEGKNKKK